MTAPAVHGTGSTLVDVRGPDERAIASIPGAVAVHLDELRSGAGAGAACPFDHAVVVHCKSGARSAEAVRILLDAGHPDVAQPRRRGAGLGPRRRPEPARLLTVTELPDYEEAVLEVVDAIPEGWVMTYGDVAEMVGAMGPRRVGRVMSRVRRRTCRGGASSGPVGTRPRGWRTRRWRTGGRRARPLVRRRVRVGGRVDMARARWDGTGGRESAVGGV